MHFETFPCCQGYSLLAPWVNWFMGLHTHGQKQGLFYPTGQKIKYSGKDRNREGNS